MRADCAKMRHCHDALHVNVRRILRANQTLKREARLDRLRVAIRLVLAAAGLALIVEGAYLSCNDLLNTWGIAVWG